LGQIMKIELSYWILFCGNNFTDWSFG